MGANVNKLVDAVLGQLREVHVLVEVDPVLGDQFLVALERTVGVIPGDHLNRPRVRPGHAELLLGDPLRDVEVDPRTARSWRERCHAQSYLAPLTPLAAVG